MSKRPFMRILSFRVPDETYAYIQDLSEAMGIPMGWIARRLLEYAVKEHKEGRLELLTMEKKA
jgi:predicted DNA-binding protein